MKNYLEKLLIIVVISLNLSATALSSEKADTVLGYSTYGNGKEKVIVLHDWMGDSSNYEPATPYLDPITFTYVFADVRGYGKSRHLKGKYTVTEVAADVFHLADSLGWKRFHVIGHSMNGMTVQRMAIDDWTSGKRRLKSVVAVSPVTADGYPADEGTKKFLWDAIHNRDVSQMAFAGLTGKQLLPSWGRLKTNRNLATSTPEAMKGYYRMWLETDFSKDAQNAKAGIPMLVLGGRQDFPGFGEEKYQQTFSQWYPKVELRFITDAGHYSMQETPVLFASLIEKFLRNHQ